MAYQLVFTRPSMLKCLFVECPEMQRNQLIVYQTHAPHTLNELMRRAVDVESEPKIVYIDIYPT